MAADPILRQPLIAPSPLRAASAPKLRILIVISGLGRGGAERQAIALANHLNPAACEVRIVSISGDIALADDLAPHVGLEVLAKRWRFDPSMAWRLAAAIRRFGPHVVQAYFFDSEILARVSAALAGGPPVVGSERNSAHPGMWWRARIDRFTSRGCRHVIANSRAGAAYRAALLNRSADDFSVVYNGVDAAVFSPGSPEPGRRLLGLAPGDRVVLMTANFKPQKNHPLFFEVAKRVLERVPAARFVLAGGTLSTGPHGSGPYHRRMHALLDRLGLRDRCVFAGVQKDMTPLYRAADVVVLTSLHEGTPNVVLEAMACGRPVVVTAVADNVDIVGDAGFAVEVNQPETFAARVVELLTDDELRANAGGRGRARVLERFTFTRVAEETEHIYRRVCSS